MTRLALKMLLLGGLAGLATVSAVQASPAVSDVPALVVKYDPATLETDGGARALYYRLRVAAEQVCPAQPSETRLPNEKVVKCRQQAIAAAVRNIHSQRLAAIFAAHSKSG
jgi:UrcA family protein